MVTNNLGIGAICSVKLKYLHPRRVVDSMYTNPAHGTVVRDALVIGQEERTVNGRKQGVVLLRHESFHPHDVYAVKRWCNVTVGAPEGNRFTDGPEAPAGVPENEEDCEEIVLPSAETRREDITQTRADGFDVDDDDANNGWLCK